MAGYNTIRGLRVKYLSADPANPEDGQVWYNSTTGNLRVEGIQGTAAWASGGNLPAIRSGSGGAGTQTAALNIAGENGATIFGTTEEYNGSSWTAGGGLNTSPSFLMASGGTQTAGLRIGGYTGPVGTVLQNAVEEYNGSSWTSVTAIPAATGNGMFAGIQTAGLFYGGAAPSRVGTSLSYDGTNWTATNSLAVTKSGGAGFGTQTAAIAAGGSGPGSPSFTDNSQTWDGTNWATTNSLNNRKTSLRGWGSSTSGAVAGGRPPSPPITNQTEVYDGTNWSASATLATARGQGSTAGGPGALSGLYAGGNSPVTSATEEFTIPVETKNLSVS